jgi:hypothetical protein
MNSVAEPAERAIRLSGRHLSVLVALAERELDWHGARVSASRLQQARGILVGTSTEELQGLLRRLESGLLQVWGSESAGN